MTEAAQRLLDDALELSHDERAALALRLSESLDRPPDEGAEAAWPRLISRRVQEVQAGTAKLVSAEEAISKAHSRGLNGGRAKPRVDR
ncbi:MAG: addiction module protein [Planctomycetes bacterium]|nr:addiction module protein [Planctomycetota bacterium]